MKYLSVCAGIEAATVAWHHMGWEPVAYSEIEPFPSAVLKHHYPSVPNWGDMTKFQEWPDANVNVLVGGTPCQSFSVAGLRKGLADPRGNLMLTYLAIAQRYRPKWLVWENVPGVLSSEGGRDFAALLRGLDELGYGWAYRVLDAQYFGVAQRRRRVFVVGHLGNWQRAAAVLFERHSLSGHPAPSRQARKGTASNTASGVGAGGWPAEVSPTLNAHFGSKQGLEDQHVNGGGGCLSPPVAMCLITKTRLDSETETLIPIAGGGFDAPLTMRESGQGYWMQDEVAGTLRAEGEDRPSRPSHVIAQPLTFKVRGGCEGGGKGYLGSDDTAFTVATTQDQWLAQPITFGAQMSVPQTDVDMVQTLQAKNPMAVAFGVGEQPDIGHCLRSGASKADKHESTTYVAQAPIGLDEEQNARVDGFGTLKARMEGGGFEGTVMTPTMQVRRLTPVECERLQGFPDGYTNIPWRGKPESPDGPRYKALGNSMAVPVMSWIGERINQVEGL